MLSPIAQLVRAAGAAATITVYAADASSDYDPTSSTPFVRGAGTDTSVTIVPSKLTEAMLARGYSGHFLAETIPAGVVPGSSVLTYLGVAYTVMALRDRVYIGVPDGWSLECRV